MNQKLVRTTFLRPSSSFGVEVEAEERAREPELEHDRDHGSGGDERLDLAVVGGGEVARVQRQEDDGKDPRHEASEPVDRRLLRQPRDLVEDRDSPPLRRRAKRGGLLAGHDLVVELEQPPCVPVGVVHLLDVPAARLADAPALLGRLDERPQRLDERLPGRVHERDLDAEGLLRALDRVLVQRGHDRLAERHRLDREQPVPARVELVDDDVGPLVALARLVVMQPLDDLQLDVQLAAGGDHVLRALPRAVGGRVDDDRARAVARRHGPELAQVDAGRDHDCVRDPADSIVGADDAGVGPAGVEELGGAPPADVGAHEVQDRLLAEEPQDRELEPLGDEGQAEVEMEDIRLRQQPDERTPLRELPAQEAALAVERPVRLGVQAIALEDDELRVDAAAAQREDVLPRHAGRVHRAVDDPQHARPSPVLAPPGRSTGSDSGVRGTREVGSPAHASSHSTWSK